MCKSTIIFHLNRLQASHVSYAFLQKFKEKLKVAQEIDFEWSL